jgi:DNA-binding protein HU-beta
VVLFGLGTFVVRDRPARMGCNPQTGESMMIAATKVAGFKAAKALKDSINNSPSLSEGGGV